MKELQKNIETFWKSSEMIYSSGDYTSATILYFKCLFVMLDLIILRNKQMTPKDHTERFRILQEDFPELYVILDKMFVIYRNTYSLQIEKENCEKVRKDVIEIAQRQEIQLGDK